ncbi:MAG: hypothetical protein GYB65_09170 [Chloroflexi bacterium]|nr:hypothetical protein [Chloroflexota bacterium]
MSPQVKILWIYRRTGRGGTEEGERDISALLADGWYIVSASTTVANDNIPILCVILQHDGFSPDEDYDYEPDIE